MSGQPIGPIFKVQGSPSSDLKMGPIGCPETSVQNYHPTLRNTPEERRSHLHDGGSLKSRSAADASFDSHFLVICFFFEQVYFCDALLSLFQFTFFVTYCAAMQRVSNKLSE